MAKSGLNCLCGRGFLETDSVCRNCGRSQLASIADVKLEERLVYAERLIEINSEFTHGIASALMGR